MKKAYVLAGGIFTIVFIIVLTRSIREYITIQSGQTVHAEIIDISKSCTDKNKYVKVLYSGKIHSIRIDRKYCENHQIGEIVTLKTLPDDDGILVIPERKVTLELISNVILVSFGVFMILKGLKRNV